MNLVGGLLRSRVSAYIAGKRRLAGRVRVNGTGRAKRVGIFKRGTLEYVASGYSNPDGTYEIKGMPELPARSLFAVAFDDTGTYNAEILDILTQCE